MSVSGWSQAGATSFGGQIKITRVERGLVVVMLITLMAAIVAFGSDRNDLSLFFSALLSGEFAISLCFREIQAGIFKPQRALAVPAVLFIVCLAAIAWATTSYSPNGPHPIWAYGGQPAITVDKSALFIGIMKLAGLAFTFLFGYVIGCRDERARFFFRCFVIAVSLYAVWALISRIAPDMVLSFPKGFQGDRLSGSFQSANTAGTLFGISFLYAVALCLEKARGVSDPRKSTLYELTFQLIAIALSGTCLMLTLSRGAIGATLIAFSCFLVWEALARSWRTDGRSALINALALVGGGGVLFWSASALLDRYQDSITGRQVIFVTHWQAFLDSLWFGYGIGTFDEINKLIETAVTFPALWDIRAAHNVYLQWLESVGIIGAVPMFGCVAWIIFAIVRGAATRRRMTTWLRASFAASLVVLIHGWADFSLEVPAVAMAWAGLLGCAYAVSRSKREQSGGTPRSPNIIVFSLFTAASLAVALICLLAVVEIDAPLGQRPLLLPISSAYGYYAQDLLQTGQVTGDQDDLRGAEHWTRKELALSPLHSNGWLRLAMISALQKKPVSETSRLLDISYSVAPLDPELFEYRTKFVLDSWDAILPAVRDDARAEMSVGWRNWLERDALLRMAPAISNPSGRMAIALQIQLMSGLGTSSPKPTH